jgi:hypothetical protein
MSKRWWLGILLVSFAAAGCGAAQDDDDTVDDDDDLAQDDDDTADDDDSAAWDLDLCDDPPAFDPARTVPVEVGGPLTLAEALSLTRIDPQYDTLLLGPGTHAAFALWDGWGDGPDDALTVFGCGPDTVVEGQSAGWTAIDVASVDDVLIAGLTVTGPGMGVLIRQGAGAGGEVVLSEVTVLGTDRVGIFVNGADTVARVQDFVVEGVDPYLETAGWGVVVVEAEAVLERGTVTAVHELGVLIDAAPSVELVDLDVLQVDPNEEGRLGRGIQFQSGSSGLVERAQVLDVWDAGVALVTAGGVTVQGSTVEGVAAGSYDGQPTGDGILVLGGGLRSTLTGNTVTGNARTGILIDSTPVDLSENETEGNTTTEGDVSIYAQGSAIDDLGGLQSGEATVPAVAFPLDPLSPAAPTVEEP